MNKFFINSLFVITTTTLQAQISMTTPASVRVFSPPVVLGAKERLRLLNKHAPQKVMLSITMAYISNSPQEVRLDHVSPTANLSNLIADALVESDGMSSKDKFEAVKIQSKKRAEALFKNQPNAGNTMLINLTIGLKPYTHSGVPGVHSYQQWALFAGNKVPVIVKQDITDYLQKIKPLQFSGAAPKKNDEILEDLLSYLQVHMQPVYISYDNPADKGFDNNAPECDEFTSFKTKPLSGLPWKCIPADGTFAPIKILAVKGNSNLRFRLSNSRDFKLKSATLEPGDSLLWISCSSRNKETALIPVIDGVDSEIQQLNVVAYEKIVKKIAVVIIEEENDDVQLVPFETRGLNPNTAVVSAGRNGFLDSRPYSSSCDDKKGIDPVTGDSVIVAGPDGVCETQAASTNMIPLDLELAELERQLNEHYNPLIVEWIVDKVKHRKTLNYDLNRDGRLDLSYFIKTSGGPKIIASPEEHLIFTKGQVPGYTHHLYLIDQVDGAFDKVAAYARTDYAHQSALIFTRNIEEDKDAVESLRDAIIEICGHELGHAAFQLVDLFTTKDKLNLMTSGGLSSLQEVRLRKFQWDIIHGLGRP